LTRNRAHYRAIPGDTLANEKANENLYQAEYMGSGTFVIRKPKRKSAKKRQTKLKNPQRGARRG
jgi:hypothetical protein